ncbi:MAG: c-type cytochrome [Polyangiaceae bacterium]|nr:c-type cytochrome [Polyangiaceae bacterium]
MKTQLLTLSLFAAVLVAGCDKKDSGATGSTAAAVAPSPEAKQIYEQRCVTCHGADGKGTGPAAAALNPKPRNYTDAAWQKTVKDDELKKAIVEGGAAVGKSPLMPGNPDLKDKPEVVAGLVAIIRAFK